MKTEDLARRIEETAIGPFSILLGLGEEHFNDLVAARALIVKALNNHEALVKAIWNLCALAEYHGLDNAPAVQAARRAISAALSAERNADDKAGECQ